MRDLNNVDGFFYAKSHNLLCIDTKISKKKIELVKGRKYAAYSYGQDGVLILVPHKFDFDEVVLAMIKKDDELMQKLLFK